MGSTGANAISSNEMSSKNFYLSHYARGDNGMQDFINAVRSRQGGDKLVGVNNNPFSVNTFATDYNFSYYDNVQNIDSKYGMSDFIKRNKDLQLKDSVPLYRGLALDDAGYSRLLAQVQSGEITTSRLTSWSMWDRVAGMYAQQYDLMGATSSESLPHHIVLINLGKHKDAMVYPLSDAHREVLQASGVRYRVIKHTTTKPKEITDTYYIDNNIEYFYIKEI